MEGWVLCEEVLSGPGHALLPPWSFGDATPAAARRFSCCQCSLTDLIDKPDAL